MSPDLNWRPVDLQSTALTAELHTRELYKSEFSSVYQNSMFQCPKKHAMTKGMSYGTESGRFYCNLCFKEIPSAGIALSCGQCSLDVCHLCKDAYTDIAFALYMGSTDKLSKFLPYYKEKPDSALLLYRSPFHAPVYHSYQEFYQTKEHHNSLKRGVEYAEQEVKEAKRMLQCAEDKLVKAKLELDTMAVKMD